MPTRVSSGRARYLDDELAELLSIRQRGPRPSPLLDRALAFIGAHIPASEGEISRRLIAAGLARGPLDLARIERAARYAETAPPFAVLRRDGFVLAVPASTLALASTAYRLAVRAIVHCGLALVRRIAFQANSDDLPLVTGILAAKDSFRWLDRPLGWFWFENEQSSLVRAIEKVLRVAGSARLDDLSNALFRRWAADNVPSRRALSALCHQAPRLRVTGHVVSLATPHSGDGALSPIEETLVSLFRRCGPRLESYRLHEIAGALGMACAQLGRALRSSPFVLEPQPGIFRLIGT